MAVGLLTILFWLGFQRYDVENEMVVTKQAENITKSLSKYF